MYFRRRLSYIQKLLLEKNHVPLAVLIIYPNLTTERVCGERVPRRAYDVFENGISFEFCGRDPGGDVPVK